MIAYPAGTVDARGWAMVAQRGRTPDNPAPEEIRCGHELEGRVCMNQVYAPGHTMCGMHIKFWARRGVYVV